LRVLDERKIQPELLTILFEAAESISVVCDRLHHEISVVVGNRLGDVIEPDRLPFRSVQVALLDPDLIRRLVLQRSSRERVAWRPRINPSVDMWACLRVCFSPSISTSNVHAAGLNNARLRGDVSRLREVEPFEYLFAVMLSRVELSEARLQSVPRHPCCVGIRPAAEVQPQDAVEFPRHRPRLLDVEG
jgi:hypothetical protein